MDYGVLVISELRRRQFDERRVGQVRVQFADRVGACLKREVILCQSKSTKYVPGYFAAAALLHADVSAQDARFLFLTFSKPTYLREAVAVHSAGPILERSVQNEDGTLNGRKFAEDFGVLSENEFLALVGDSYFAKSALSREFDGFDETLDKERQRVTRDIWQRSVEARSLALPLYNYGCAVTGQKMLSRNGLGTGLQACHLMSVATNGPDVAGNLVILCPDFHVRYDNGTIDILEDFTWVPVGNNQDEIINTWTGPRKLFVPDNPQFRLDPKYLAAHRFEVLQRQGP